MSCWVLWVHCKQSELPLGNSGCLQYHWVTPIVRSAEQWMSSKFLSMFGSSVAHELKCRLSRGSPTWCVSSVTFDTRHNSAIWGFTSLESNFQWYFTVFLPDFWCGLRRYILVPLQRRYRHFAEEWCPSLNLIVFYSTLQGYPRPLRVLRVRSSWKLFHPSSVKRRRPYSPYRQWVVLLEVSGAADGVGFVERDW